MSEESVAAPAAAPPPREPERRIERVVQRSRLSGDLIEAIKDSRKVLIFGDEASDSRLPVIIELNNNYPGGARQARARVLKDYLDGRDIRATRIEAGAERELILLAEMSQGIEEFHFEASDELFLRPSAFTDHYLFGRLNASTLEAIANLPNELESGNQPLIHKVWLDRETGAFIDTSYRTIKCDAGQTAFGARGRDIVWAVADTGIQGDHLHFARHENLDLPHELMHADFTRNDLSETASAQEALKDDDGHGTHVAGILAGETIIGRTPDKPVAVDRIIATLKRRLDSDETEEFVREYTAIAGASPETKLMSLKVLSGRSAGRVSALLAAIGYVQRANENGRNIRVHGLNLSLGYTFDPEWFAAGQSPLCNEVNRLVRSGVVVVVAAGNGGYGSVLSMSGKSEKAAHASTIADPGNADLAITVGSTHRDRPHEYGVSYFSAKGPTADGRCKPDLVAPGERIVSCSTKGVTAGQAEFREETGTSMAAPHVSAAIAAFLSVRREFIGKPDRIKALFMANATDLGRQRDFQGAGLIDLMRTLQAV